MAVIDRHDVRGRYLVQELAPGILQEVVAPKPPVFEQPANTEHVPLGANRRNALWLLFRASFPGIFSSFRILYDIGWTYVILAEMVNARRGVGYMVEAARKMMDFERVYAGIIAIGVAAFLFRWLLTVLEGWLFPWRRAVQPASASVAAIGAGRKAKVAHDK